MTFFSSGVNRTEIPGDRDSLSGFLGLPAFFGFIYVIQKYLLT